MQFVKFVVKTRRLVHQVRRFAFQALEHPDVLHQLDVGMEADADLLDVGGGIEVVRTDGGLGEALAADLGLERAELVEDDALSLQQMAFDELLHGGEDGHDVGLGGRGGELDVIGQQLEVVVARLLGTVGGILYTFATLRVGAFDDLIHNRHKL